MIIGDMEIRLRADIARLQADMTAARQSVTTATNGMARAADAAKAALAGIGLGAGLAQVIQMSDQYTKFTAQLKLATQSQREYAQALSDVKRISTDAQSSMAGAGTLYARIANGTRELGVSQKQVADITEAVSLGLKVSGATAEESSSAMLQLSQSFASGTLRGEEFNAVNEAAPRLMKALADGIGVPVGALKQMASDGQITSKVMADTLPKALASLRDEATQVQTIGGAFQVLKDRVMEFTAVHAQANGTVSVLTTGIGLLANNLTLLMGIVSTLTAVKLGTWAAVWAKATYDNIIANRALAASTLAAAVTSTEATATITAAKFAEAAANTRATASELALAEARVVELRAAVLAADGAVALAIATNGLIPAQTRAIALADAHAASLAAQAVAGGAATTAAVASTVALEAQAAATTLAARAMGVLRGVMAFLGGPIGLIITLLGAAATAWAVYGDKAKASNEAAAATTEASTQEIVQNLEKQNVKLRERLVLSKSYDIGGAAAGGPEIERLAQLSTELDTLTKKQKDFTASGKAMDVGDQLHLVNVQGLYDNLKATIDANKGLKDEVEKTGSASKDLVAVRERLTGVNKQYLDDLSKLQTAYEKGAISQAEYTSSVSQLATETWKSSTAGKDAEKQSKAGASAIKQEVTAYKALMTSIAEKIAANKLELSGYNTLSESQKATIKLDAEIGTGKNKLSAQSIASARAEITAMAAQETAITNQTAALEMKAAARKSEVETDNEAYAKISAGTKSIDDQIVALKEQIRVFGLTEVAVVDLAIAKANAEMAAGPASYAELIALDAQIAKLGELRALTSKKQVLDEGVGSSVAQAKDLLDIMSALDEATKSAASGMANSFGQVGTAIGSLTTALSGYARAQAAVAAQLAVSTKDAGGDQTKIQRANATAAQQSAQAQVKSYGDMASAAKGFFKQNSTGYKVLEGTEKAYRALEMAMAIQNMVAKSGLVEAFTGIVVAGKATETAASVASVAPDVAASMAKGTAAAAVGVANQAQGDPYSAFARMAAMAALMAAIGFAVAGGGGGDTTAADRQKANGTGTVLGDSSAKSNSIARAVEVSAKNSNILLDYTAAMVTALNSIQSNIGGFASQLLQSTTVGSTLPATQQGTASSIVSSTAFNVIAGGALGVLAVSIDKLLGGKLGNFVGKVANAIFGGNTTAIDTGVTATKTSLGSAVANGVKASQYVDTKTDGGWFHSDKYNTQLTSLGAAANDQFTLIVQSLASSVTEAGKLLGVGGDAFTAHLNQFVIDIGTISTKDLTGDEIQTAIQAAFSKMGDDMANWAVAGLGQFQKVGEGALETLARVASDYANVDSVLNSIGKTFGSVGLGSIAARENLIALAGGIDQLASETSGFASNFLSQAEQLAPVQKYVTDQLAAMGLAGVQTRDDFKNVVLGLDLTNPAAQQTYASLMALQDAFAKTHTATVDLTKSEQEIADERTDLLKQIDQLTLTSTQIRAKERAGISATNLVLYDMVTQLQSAADMSDTLKTSISSLKAFRDGILSFKDSLTLGSLSTLTPMQKAAEAQRQYQEMLAKAQGGDTTAQAGIQAAATAYLTANQAINASSSAYVAASAGVQADLAALAATVGTQMSDAQMQLAVLDQQVSQLTALNATADSIEAALTSSNWSAIGTADMSPLVDEIKGLRADNAQLRADNADLVAAVNSQTAAVVQATLAAAAANAKAVTAGAAQVATSQTWAQRLANEVAQ